MDKVNEFLLNNLIIVIALIGLMVCVIISTIIIYRFSKKRLKVALELKIVDELLGAIQTFSDVSNKIMKNSSYCFSLYNSTVDLYLKLDNCEDENDSEIKSFLKNQVKERKDHVFKYIFDYCNEWKLYEENFLLIVNIMETKEVVLNKFIGIRQVLLDEFAILSQVNKNIIDYYTHEIESNLLYNKAIEQKLLIELNKKFKEFNDKNSKTVNIICDLKIALQNEFLASLFGYKVPYRKLTCKNDKIYKAGYKHKVVSV